MAAVSVKRSIIALSITMDCYRLLPILLIDKFFFCDFDFYRFPISIDINGGLNRLISMISTDFRYRFLSINYVWGIMYSIKGPVAFKRN